MSRADCPFCQALPKKRILAESDIFIVLLDSYPVSAGHTLVIPRQHVASLFDLAENQQAVLWEQVGVVRNLLVEKYSPAGFNVALNDGRAAGQTVPHAHIHIIPRYAGDVPDPRGGVRWVIPAKAKYW